MTVRFACAASALTLASALSAPAFAQGPDSVAIDAAAATVVVTAAGKSTEDAAAGFEQFAPRFAVHQLGDVGEGRVGDREAADDFVRHFALTDAGCVFQTTENQIGTALIIIDICLFDVRVDLRLLRRTKTRAHIDAICAECQRCDQTTSVTKAATCQHGDFYLIGSSWDQDQTGNVIFAGMTRAFETIDRNRIATIAFSRQGMTDGGAFVDDLDAMRLQLRPLRFQPLRFQVFQFLILLKRCDQIKVFIIKESLGIEMVLNP